MMPDPARRVQTGCLSGNHVANSWAGTLPSSVTTLKRSDVERIAALAHLDLTESETELFTRQLGDILSYFDQLQQIDTTGVPATSHPVTSAPVMRADEPRPSLPRDEVLASAPDPGGDGLFRVPKAIG